MGAEDFCFINYPHMWKRGRNVLLNVVSFHDVCVMKTNAGLTKPLRVDLDSLTMEASDS